jgi:hypothetical protein
MNVVMARASRDPDRTAVLRLARELEWVGPGLVGPSSLVVIGLGIWLVLLEERGLLPAMDLAGARPRGRLHGSGHLLGA